MQIFCHARMNTNKLQGRQATQRTHSLRFAFLASIACCSFVNVCLQEINIFQCIHLWFCSKQLIGDEIAVSVSRTPLSSVSRRCRTENQFCKYQCTLFVVCCYFRSARSFIFSSELKAQHKNTQPYRMFYCRSLIVFAQFIMFIGCFVWTRCVRLCVFGCKRTCCCCDGAQRRTHRSLSMSENGSNRHRSDSVSSCVFSVFSLIASTLRRRMIECWLALYAVAISMI